VQHTKRRRTASPSFQWQREFCSTYPWFRQSKFRYFCQFRRKLLSFWYFQIIFFI
jgi:hypothetical protein